jgi:hypothetical protein
MKNKYEIGAYVEYQMNDELGVAVNSIRTSLIVYSEVWNEGLPSLPGYHMSNRDYVFEDEIIRELTKDEALILRLAE